MDFSKIFSFNTNGLISIGSDGTENENENENGVLDSLSYFERMSLFIVTLAGVYICYSISLFFIIISPRKFAVLWSFGSILFLISFTILMGPKKFINHFISGERLMYSISFFISIMATLIFSFIYRSMIGVLFSIIIQFVCTIAYSVSYFPLGRQSLQLGSTIARDQVSDWLNIS